MQWCSIRARFPSVAPDCVIKTVVTCVRQKANKAIPIGRMPYLHDPDPVPGKSIDGENICRANE